MALQGEKFKRIISIVDKLIEAELSIHKGKMC